MEDFDASQTDPMAIIAHLNLLPQSGRGTTRKRLRHPARSSRVHGKGSNVERLVPMFARSYPPSGKTIAVCTYAVYFSTLPVHLWGRSQAGDDSRASPPVPSAPARRVERPWSQMAFVPGHPGEVVFVQGWSPRVLLTNLSTEEEDRCGGGTTLARGERFGLLEGSRVLALDGHGAHVRDRPKPASFTFRPLMLFTQKCIYIYIYTGM